MRSDSSQTTSTDVSRPRFKSHSALPPTPTITPLGRESPVADAPPAHLKELIAKFGHGKDKAVEIEMGPIKLSDAELEQEIVDEVIDNLKEVVPTFSEIKQSFEPHGSSNV